MGTVLEELGRGDPDRRLSEIAHHLALAAPLGDMHEGGRLPRAGRRPRGDAARLRGGGAALRSRPPAARHREPRAPTGGAATCSCASATPSGGRATSRPRASSFEEAIAVARRLGEGELLARAALGYVTALGGFLLLRALRGRRDRRRAARRGARRASRGRQPAAGDPALAARGRAVLGERAGRAPRRGAATRRSRWRGGSATCARS